MKSNNVKKQDLTPSVALKSEDRLMFLCARINMDPETKEKAQKIIKQDLDWNYILNRGRLEGTLPLIYHNFDGLDINQRIPINIKEKLEDDYFTRKYLHTIVLDKLHSILGRFKEENVPAILLKGCFLVENVYKNLGLRPLSDIDILIRKEDLVKVNSLLKRAGYHYSKEESYFGTITNRPFSKYLNSIDYILDPDINLSLHLHWHLVNSILPKYIYTRIDIEKVWRNADWIHNKTYMGMAPHHLLIHLCEHAFRHSWDRMILLSDIRETFSLYKEKLNYQSLLNDCREFRVTEPVYYTLYFIKTMMGFDIPNHILNTLQPKNPGFGERLFLRCALKNTRPSELSCLAYSSIIKNIRGKTTFWFRLFFPPKSVLALAYGKHNRDITISTYLRRFLRGIRYTFPHFREKLNS